jgi:hypothetical protein
LTHRRKVGFSDNWRPLADESLRRRSSHFVVEITDDKVLG